MMTKTKMTKKLAQLPLLRVVKHMAANEHRITSDGTRGAWVDTKDVAVGDVLTIYSVRLGKSYVATVTELVPYYRVDGTEHPYGSLVRVGNRVSI